MVRSIILTLGLVLLAGCAKKDPEAHAMTPQESLKSIHLSDDFHVELFAAEPDVMSPVEMVFDESGRIYVAEMLDYPDDPPAGKPARSRIRLLEDTDGDGKIDRATMFADHVLAVSGILPWKGGLIVTSAPDILYFKDTNGDGKADVRQVLYTGFGKVNQESRITNPRLSVDNWVYCANAGSDGRITSPAHPEMPPVLVRGTDFRFDPISGRAEAASGPTQFGMGLDDFGNRFITQNTTHIRHVVMPLRYLARAPLLQAGAVAQDISDHGRPSARMYPLTQPQAWRRERTRLRQQRYDENKLNRIEEVGGWFTAASGGTLYTGDAFPPEYRGSVFTGDVSGNLVHRDVITPDGATFAAHRAKDKVEFLASTDVWFRPCNFANAPDGNLYLTDIYRQVIETPESIPEEIRKKINFYNGDTLGRIYRIVPNHPQRKGDLKPNLGRMSSAELVKQLQNPNGWHRQTAHRLLLERQDRSVAPQLAALAQSAAPAEARVHALWLLQALSALTPEMVARAAADPDERIRVQALRLSEPMLRKSAALERCVLNAASDSSAAVQFQAALTLGELRSSRAMAPLLAIARAHSADSWFRLAVLSSVADEPSAFYHALLAKGADWSDPRLFAGLSALIGARQNTVEIARWFATLDRLKAPDQALAGLTSGLRMAGGTRLKVPAAEKELMRLLAGGSEPVQHAAWEAARYFELEALLRKASAEALDARGATPNRVMAIRAFRGGRFEEVAPVLKKIVESHPPDEVQAAVIDSLAAFDGPAPGRTILEFWRSYSPVARQHAVDAMLAQRDRVPLLLAAIEQGTVERSAIDAAARSRLYDNPDPGIRKRARALLESGQGDRGKVVAAYHDVVNMTGDVGRGKTIFDANCARCHMPRRGGDRVGPDLSGINNKTKEELLTSILNPSYAIEPHFVNYIVTTRDGRIYDGVIANETPGAITLRGGSEEGGDETILRPNIADIRASTVSLMPDGFEEHLNKQDLADLIAYLRGGL